MKLHLIILAVFTLSIPTVSASAKSLDFALGKALFDRIWTPAPASTDATDGLGPLFNARSCVSCHPAGGRGQFKESINGDISGLGLIVRIGNSIGEGDPTYGIQLQTHGVQGLRAEGIRTRKEDGSLSAENLAFGPADAGTKFGGRLATTLQGIGLLERVSETSIRAWADPDDTDNDGVSGRINSIMNSQGVKTIGRFGSKAGKASLYDQSAAALHTDLGLSNSVHREHFGDCTETQNKCRTAPNGASTRFENLEIGSEMMRLIVTYVSRLKPPKPAHKKVDGLTVFTETGCAACHRPSLPLSDGKTISAYTDLLLHDMGAELADGIGDGSASGSEWRTPPLWGLSKATRYLHDGRAKSVREAIEWHGGEAKRAKNAFTKLSEQQQKRLLNYLKGL